jgi:hypothetical protein
MPDAEDPSSETREELAEKERQRKSLLQSKAKTNAKYKASCERSHHTLAKGAKGAQGGHQ